MTTTMVIHSHPLSVNGTDPTVFTMTHEHEDGDKPHTHEVTPDGKRATSTTWAAQ